MANPQTSQHPTLSKTKHEHSRERTQGSNAGPTTAAFRAEKNRVAAGGGGCRTFDTASRGLCGTWVRYLLPFSGVPFETSRYPPFCLT